MRDDIGYDIEGENKYHGQGNTLEILLIRSQLVEAMPFAQLITDEQ